jgi:hypothetical protein
MRHRTAALLFGAAASAGAAAVGAAAAVLVRQLDESRMDRYRTALAEALITMPRYDADEAVPDGQRPGLELIHGGRDS